VRFLSLTPTTAQQLATIRANQTQIIMPDLAKVLANQATIIANQEKIMATLDDFNAAVMGVQTAVATAITLIEALHTSSGGGGSVTDAEVEAAVASLNKASSDLAAAVPKP
jgi:uncharacterized iron-regulated membrane protein